MNKEKQEFTITAYTENYVGLLHRLSIIFTKRKINLESLTASDSEMEGVHRFTVAIHETEDNVKKVVRQIEKQVDVFKAGYYRKDQVVQQEMALYKIPTEKLAHGGKVEQIIRDHHARVLTVEKDFTIIEKTGFRRETISLFEELKPYGIKEFVRSGRIAVSREAHGIGEQVEALINANG